MTIEKSAALLTRDFRIVSGEGLQLGDVVSILPGLWCGVCLVVDFAGEPHILRLDATSQNSDRPFQNLHRLSEYDRTTFLVIKNAHVVPLLSEETFDVNHPGKNGLGIAGEQILCVGWINHGYALFDSQTGAYVDRQRLAPLFISGWDLVTRDADDQLVSVLRVRPD